MNQGYKKPKKVKVTTIPIQVFDNPQEYPGLVQFQTENSSVKLKPVTCSTIRCKTFVPYHIVRRTEPRRGREIQHYTVTINTARYRNKRYKLDIPIIRGKRPRNRVKDTQLYFSFTFTLYQGTITLLSGMQNAKVEFQPLPDALSFEQRMERQIAELDNRRQERTVINGAAEDGARDNEEYNDS